LEFDVKETMARAGYRYVRYDAANRGHILQELDSDTPELWVANKNHASYGIIFKNTHLEFASSVQANS
jgi:hypothetical protein